MQDFSKYAQAAKPDPNEVHTVRELYDKYKARRNSLDPKVYIHAFPDENNRFSSFKADYVPTEPQDVVDEKMKDVKYRKQPTYSLEDWKKYGYYNIYDEKVEEWVDLCNKVQEAHLEGKTYRGLRALDRFDYRDISYEYFVEHYEKQSKPCMIGGFAEGWKMNQWTFKTISENFLKDQRVKVGKDDDGYPIRVEAKYEIQYLATNKDDSPVYLFESQLAENENIQKIFDYYDIPPWFRTNLFDLLPKKRIPPYRWLTLGGTRSGTTMHIDPLYTAAWNTVVAGRKIWILFPQGTPEEIWSGKKFMSTTPMHPNIENEAIGWFDRVFVAKMLDYFEENPHIGATLVVQEPLDTIYVPGCCPHFVVNTDDCLAMTQNYCPRTYAPFSNVWKDFRKERKHVARRFGAIIKKNIPELARIVKQIDAREGPVKFSKQSKARKAERKERLAKIAQLKKDGLPVNDEDVHTSDEDESGEWDSSTDASSDDSDISLESTDDEEATA